MSLVFTEIRIKKLLLPVYQEQIALQLTIEEFQKAGKITQSEYESTHEKSRQLAKQAADKTREKYEKQESLCSMF